MYWNLKGFSKFAFIVKLEKIKRWLRWSILYATEIGLSSMVAYLVSSLISISIWWWKIVADCDDDRSCVNILPYDKARDDLEFTASFDSSLRFWMPSSSTTYGMYSVVDEVRDHLLSFAIAGWLKIKLEQYSLIQQEYFVVHNNFIQSQT